MMAFSGCSSGVLKRSRGKNKKLPEEKKIPLGDEYTRMVEAFTSLTKRYEQAAEENYRLKKENKNFSEAIDNISGECSYLKTINERAILENMNSKETIQKLICQNSELERKLINQSRYLELIDRSIIVARSAIALSEQENID